MIDRAAVIAALKSRYGVRLRDRWLDACAAHLDATLPQQQQQQQPGHTAPLHVEAQVRLVLEQLLHSEISDSCVPVLATGGGSGPSVLPQDGARDVLLQIQEIVDVGVSRFAMWEALREKEDFEQRGIRPSYLPPPPPAEDEGVFTAATQMTQADGGGEAAADERQPKVPRAMLKLVLTDGATLLPAIEVDRVAQLDAELPVGTKVLVTRAQAHVLQPTGTLCLRPGVIKVLGGRPQQYEQLTQKARLEKSLDALRQQQQQQRR